MWLRLSLISLNIRGSADKLAKMKSQFERGKVLVMVFCSGGKEVNRHILPSLPLCKFSTRVIAELDYSV
jgi:hypothetical protein